MWQGQDGGLGVATGNLLSIVVPAHNEEANVATLHAALCAVASKTAMDVEIIFVDDGSTDQTRQRIAAIQARDERVRLVALTRNFGHQAALLAGLEQARGDAVISMDCDLQHPPSLIPQMIAAWQSGASVVETIRDETEGASWGKRITSRLFYRFINMLSDTPITPGAADFRLLDRKPLNDLLRLRDQRLFLRGMVAWLGYPHASLHYVAGARVAGRSSYSLRRMISFAVDAITAFSAKPLRVAFYVGVIAALLTLCYTVPDRLPRCAWACRRRLDLIDAGRALPRSHPIDHAWRARRVYRPHLRSDPQPTALPGAGGAGGGPAAVERLAAQRPSGHDVSPHEVS